MRILVLSNFYPPARPGGYTQWCYEVAEGLKARGHEVAVLTSRYEREKAPGKEADIWRVLYLENHLDYYAPLDFFLHWRKQQRENRESLRGAISSFAPEVIFVWGMWALSRSLPALAETLMPGRVVYYLSDYWPSAQDMHTAYWSTPAQHRSLQPIKSVLASFARRILASEVVPPLKFQHVMTVSAAVRDKLVSEGLPVGHAKVVYGGTDVSRFESNTTARAGLDGETFRLLYVGQLVEHKGVHTALEAISRLRDGGELKFHLTVVGSGHPAYEAGLRDFVQRKDLSKWITFRGPVPRESIEKVYSEHDILMFPSIYPEPLARVTQEAMLAGLVVIGTTTGGTKEILEDGVNGLTFPAGDAAALAAQIERLMENPEMMPSLSHAGRQTVLEKFSQERMLNEIERFLEGVVAG